MTVEMLLDAAALTASHLGLDAEVVMSIAQPARRQAQIQKRFSTWNRKQSADGPE